MATLRLPVSFTSFTENLSRFLSCRHSLLEQAKKIINLLNQLAHVNRGGSSSRSSDSSRQPILKVDAVAASVREEIRESLELLGQSETKLLQLLKLISSVARYYCTANNETSDMNESTIGSDTNKSTASWPVDSDHLSSVIHKLQQQTLLELSAVEEITRSADQMMPVEQSKSISLLACFTYPPYISSNDLAALIALT